MGITNHAREVPEVTWRYWGIVEFMDKYPGNYGMEQMRCECHEELCAYYGIDHDESQTITFNLNELENAVELHDKLCELRDNKRTMNKGSD